MVFIYFCPKSVQIHNTGPDSLWSGRSLEDHVSVSAVASDDSELVEVVSRIVLLQQVRRGRQSNCGLEVVIEVVTEFVIEVVIEIVIEVVIAAC